MSWELPTPRELASCSDLPRVANDIVLCQGTLDHDARLKPEVFALYALYRGIRRFDFCDQTTFGILRYVGMDAAVADHFTPFLGGVSQRRVPADATSFVVTCVNKAWYTWTGCTDFYNQHGDKVRHLGSLVCYHSQSLRVVNLLRHEISLLDAWRQSRNADQVGDPGGSETPRSTD